MTNVLKKIKIDILKEKFGGKEKFIRHEYLS